MTRLDYLAARARPWWEQDPARLRRDLDDLRAAGFDLTWTPDGSGLLTGRLPLWPLDRPAPAGLEKLLDGRGLAVGVAFGHAYPMVCPAVTPLDPAPSYDRWTMHKWHVMGDGSLCLLQSAQAWDPLTPLSDVLRKSAAWRVEYVLLEAGVIDTMSSSGIVTDDSYDHLVRIAADLKTQTDAAIDDEAWSVPGGGGEAA